MHTTNRRSLDSVSDWHFFVKDCPVPDDCLPLIRPFTEEAARAVWCEFIDSDARHSHPMMLTDTSWPVQLLSSSTSAHWQDDWNDDSATDFGAWLRRIVTWPDDAPVIFTWASTDSVETTWSVFCRCWRSFLFDDEGPFIWSLQQSDAIRFMPSGVAYVERRFCL